MCVGRMPEKRGGTCMKVTQTLMLTLMLALVLTLMRILVRILIASSGRQVVGEGRSRWRKTVRRRIVTHHTGLHTGLHARLHAELHAGLHARLHSGLYGGMHSGLRGTIWSIRRVVVKAGDVGVHERAMRSVRHLGLEVNPKVARAHVAVVGHDWFVVHCRCVYRGCRKADR
jgi:hypothetical protein